MTPVVKNENWQICYSSWFPCEPSMKMNQKELELWHSQLTVWNREIHQLTFWLEIVLADPCSVAGCVSAVIDQVSVFKSRVVLQFQEARLLVWLDTNAHDFSFIFVLSPQLGPEWVFPSLA